MSGEAGSTRGRRRESIASLVLCALGVVIASHSLQLQLGAWDQPGAGFFPFWSGALLAFLSFLIFVRALVRPLAEGVAWDPRARWRQLALVVGALFAYCLLIEPLGFPLSTFLLLVVLFWVMGAGRLWVVTVGSAFTTAVVYVSFKFWLGVQLPAGPLGF